MKHILLAILLHLFGIGMHGQATPTDKLPAAQPAPPDITLPMPALPPGVTLSDPMFPFPAELKAAFRGNQIQWDELELDTQRMLLKIEQNRAKQLAAMEANKVIAIKFAQEKHIDLDLYEVDGNEVRFIKSKKNSPPIVANKP